jgi:two-component system, OmpR family, sensor histidine kinase KdpD
MPMPRLNLALRLAVACGLVALATAFHRLIGLTNTTTVALSYLLIVLGVATAWGLAESLVCSVAATLCFNYYFLAPVGTWAIADIENWVALFSLLVVAVVASELSERARQKTRQLLQHEEEKARIAELARNAEMIRRSETFKSTLLDGLAHELKTPLTSLKASVSALRSRQIVRSGEETELLEIIEEETDRLNRLISEVLQMARMEAGKLRLNAQPCRVETLIAAARENSQRSLEGRPVEVAVEPGMPDAWADPELAETVLRHLLGNAAKYSTPGTPVKICGLKGENQISISVADQGPGLSEGELAHLFEPYYRGPATAHLVSGMGMGLAIAHDIVAAHGGRIWAESCPSRGSVFTFTLPTAKGKHP